MKKIKIPVLIIISAFVLFWISSIAMCEYNTYKYGEFFRNTKIHDIGGEGYLDDCKIKVLKYNDDYAEVYAVFENDLNEVGLLYYFKKMMTVIGFLIIMMLYIQRWGVQMGLFGLMEDNRILSLT